MSVITFTGAKAPLGKFLESCPAGWAVATFGDVAETQLGKMLSQKTRPAGNPKPYLRNQNVQWGRFDLRDVWTLEIRPDEAKRFQLVAGDLLICEGGEVGRAAIWNGEIADCYYQKALHRVRPGPRASARYLYWIMTLYKARDLLQGFSTGTTIPHLPQEALRELPLPIPPLDEQRRLVIALENQINRVASAVDDVQKAVTQTSSLERSILVHAFREASALSVGSFRLGQISEVRLGRQRSPKNHTGQHMKSYLRAANIGWSGLLLDDVKQMNFAPREQAVYRLLPGDIILSEASGSRNEVGKPAIWLGELTDCYFQNTLLRVRPKAGVEPRYLLAFFRMLARTGAFARTSRGVGIHHLGAHLLGSWEVPLPNAADQRRLVARLDEALLSVTRLRGELRIALARATKLRNTILNAAFTGKLSIGIEATQDGEMAQSHQLAGLPL